MHWENLDKTTWGQMASYIDTLCIPIAPVSFENQEEQFPGEPAISLHRTGSLLEKKLTGRLLLVPPIIYLKGGGEAFLSTLYETICGLKQGQFQCIVLLSYKEDKDILLALQEMDPHVVVISVSSYKESSLEELEAQSYELYHQIIHHWESLEKAQVTN